MIVDTSVLVAILREEPDGDALLRRINDHRGLLRISAATYLEAGLVLDGDKTHALSDALDKLLREFEFQIVPVSYEHVRHARFAHRHYGKGNHPARLNFGDCFAYALARATGEPLLFKGGDFALTDVDPA